MPPTVGKFAHLRVLVHVLGIIEDVVFEIRCLYVISWRGPVRSFDFANVSLYLTFLKEGCHRDDDIIEYEVVVMTTVFSFAQLDEASCLLAGFILDFFPLFI